MKTNLTFRVAMLGLGLMAMVQASPAWSGEYSPVSEAIRSGNYTLARQRLAPFLSGCKGMAYYLLAVIEARAEKAKDTARAADTALKCRGPALVPAYVPEAKRLLRWAEDKARGRWVEISFWFSEAGDTSDVTLLTAEFQKVEQERQTLAEIQALASEHGPLGANDNCDPPQLRGVLLGEDQAALSAAPACTPREDFLLPE